MTDLSTIPQRDGLSVKRLRELVHYDPNAGTLTRIKATSNSHKVGDIAGWTTIAGYRRVNVGGHMYLAHRLAWLWMTGEWPSGVIDHINGIGTDNRWANLRDTTTQINGQNRLRARRNSRTGFLGVAQRGKRFIALIHAGPIHKYLGIFPTAELAHAAYVKAKRELHPGGTL